MPRRGSREGRGFVKLVPSRRPGGPFREGAFATRLHDERTAAILGVALGVSFLLLFLTGLVSHLIQHPPGWFAWPSRPAGLYRITQGFHIAAGLASIPLLLAKLWVAYPRLFHWPPVNDIGHAIERLSLLPLVGGSLFMLASGLFSIAGWEPWGFFFPAAHLWAAWVTIGALIVHIGAKLPVTRRVLARASRREPDPDPLTEGMTRRGLFATVGASIAVVTLATLGETVKPLRRLSLLAVRDPGDGPQGFPVNKSAVAAGVTTTALDPDYRLTIKGKVAAARSFTLDELRAMPSHEATLPIACVDGWSASETWKGVRLLDLLNQAGAGQDASVFVESLQKRGAYRAALLNPDHAHDADTLLAYEVNGEPLHIDHGYPLRLVAPNQPGVMQTKWVSRLVVR